MKPVRVKMKNSTIREQKQKPKQLNTIESTCRKKLIYYL